MTSTEALRADRLFGVKDYVCVVTGGGTGIGLMATQALAANGARVYITSRRMEALENAAKEHTPKNGGEIIPVGPCDVTKKDDLENLVKEISKKEKHVDLLVTASGIAGPKAEPEHEEASKLKARLFAESMSEWNDVWETDVAAVYFTTVAFLELLQAAKELKNDHLSPSVIVISSMSGIMSHAQGHFSYNAAKAGTAHLSKLMAHEFKKAGVRVNSIAPGYFPSEMTEKKESDERQKSELPDEKVQEKGHVPMGRAGSDEEMAQGVLFLARNKYVNGQVLPIDGGVLLDVPS